MRKVKREDIIYLRKLQSSIDQLLEYKLTLPTDDLKELVNKEIVELNRLIFSNLRPDVDVKISKPKDVRKSSKTSYVLLNVDYL